MIYLINGYGVPNDILSDGNYDRYLSACASLIELSERTGGHHLEEEIAAFMRGEGLPQCAPTIYLAGGSTNVHFPDRTEAGEMVRWFLAHGLVSSSATFCVVPGALDARGNLELLRNDVGRDAQVTIFCEYARQDLMHFLANRLFRHAVVIPIAFDGGPYKNPLARLRQLARLPLRIAAWYSPWVRRHVEYPLRLRFIRQLGEKTTKKS